MKRLALILALSLAAYATSTSIIKVSRLSDTTAAISCKNGADPTGRMVDTTLIISCGK